MKMDDSTTNSDDETADCKQNESAELETLTREDNWGKEAFRDAGEATFGSR
jgi:hypothetical protein